MQFTDSNCSNRKFGLKNYNVDRTNFQKKFCLLQKDIVATTDKSQQILSNQPPPPHQFSLNGKLGNRNSSSLSSSSSSKVKQLTDSLPIDLKFDSNVIVNRNLWHLLSYREELYHNLYDSGDVVIGNGGGRNQRQQPPPPSDGAAVKSRVKQHRCSGGKGGGGQQKFIRLPPIVGLTKSEKAYLNKGKEAETLNADEDAGETGQRDRPPEWDEYMLSRVSESTAKYLVYGRTDTEPQSSRLKEVLQEWYGPIQQEYYWEMFPDNDEETENLESAKNKRQLDPKAENPYKFYMDQIKQQHQSADDNSQQQQQQQNLQQLRKESMAQVNVTPRVQIKALLQQTSRGQEKHKTEEVSKGYATQSSSSSEESGTDIRLSTNKTAQDLAPYFPPVSPPVRLDTVLSSKVGDKLIQTDDPFTNDLLIESEHSRVKLTNQGPDVISVNNKIFTKNLQPIWPMEVDINSDQIGHFIEPENLKLGLTCGHSRWKSLPTLKENNMINIDDLDKSVLRAQLESRRKMRENTSFNFIVDEWRKKLRMSQMSTNKNVEELEFDLLTAMSDIHPTVRIQAVISAAKHLGEMDNLESDSCIRLLNAMELLLEDSHLQVNKAAAIALQSLQKASERSTTILRDLLNSKNQQDRWAAVQCLALSDTADCHVIGEIIDNLVNSDHPVIHKKAAVLLGRLSQQTNLVHGMLGEKLNTISWRHRVIVCQTLPILHGEMKKNLLNKLIHMMWNDDNREVRIAASEALGKSGNGKLVHEILIEKLSDKSELVRKDALEKLGILKILTTRLMPPFLRCFDDEYVVVRKEVCRACYRLSINDELCVGKLLLLAKYDYVWSVKVYAMRALSKASVQKDEIRQFFIWSAQFEYDARVRKEALECLIRSFGIDTEIIQMAQSRFLVEEDAKIIRIIRNALLKGGIDPDKDIDVVAMIKDKMKEYLSNTSHVAELIMSNESDQDYEQFKRDYLAEKDDAVKEKEEEEDESEEEVEQLDNYDMQSETIDYLSSKGKSKSDLNLEIDEVTRENTKLSIQSINVSDKLPSYSHSDEEVEPHGYTEAENKNGVRSKVVICIEKEEKEEEEEEEIMKENEKPEETEEILENVELKEKEIEVNSITEEKEILEEEKENDVEKITEEKEILEEKKENEIEKITEEKEILEEEKENEVEKIAEDKEILEEEKENDVEQITEDKEILEVEAGNEVELVTKDNVNTEMQFDEYRDLIERKVEEEQMITKELSYYNLTISDSRSEHLSLKSSQYRRDKYPQSAEDVGYMDGKEASMMSLDCVVTASLMEEVRSVLNDDTLNCE